MILNETPEGYLESVIEFSKKVGKEKSLQECLEFLGHYATRTDDGEDVEKTVCHLFKDFAPMSFYFVMEVRKEDTKEYVRWFNGGVIYHGPHDGFGDGGAPTFSVSFPAVDGWSIHT